MEQFENTESEFDFDFQDLTPQQIKVRVGSKAYALIEASEDAACKYRNAAMRGAKMIDGKVIGMGDAADVEPLLVSLCLCEVDKSGAIIRKGGGLPTTVPLSVVRSWPSRVVKPLFDWVRKVSDLEEKDQDTVESVQKKMAELRIKLEQLLTERGQDREGENDPTEESLSNGEDTSLLPNDSVNRSTKSSVGK